MSYYSKHIFICTNQKPAGKQCCANTGGELFFDYLKTSLLEKELHGPGKIRLSKSACLGRCSAGPCIVIYPEAIWYTYNCFKDIDDIVEQYLLKAETVERLII